MIKNDRNVLLRPVLPVILISLFGFYVQNSNNFITSILKYSKEIESRKTPYPVKSNIYHIGFATDKKNFEPHVDYYIICDLLNASNEFDNHEYYFEINNHYFLFDEELKNYVQKNHIQYFTTKSNTNMDLRYLPEELNNSTGRYPRLVIQKTKEHKYFMVWRYTGPNFIDTLAVE